MRSTYQLCRGSCESNGNRICEAMVELKIFTVLAVHIAPTFPERKVFLIEHQSPLTHSPF